MAPPPKGAKGMQVSCVCDVLVCFLFIQTCQMCSVLVVLRREIENKQIEDAAV